MPNSPRYVGFLDPPYNLTLADDSGTVLDLTGCTSNSFTLTMINQNTGLAQQGAGVWTVANQVTNKGQASYQWTSNDMATPGPWNIYTTVKLPAEPSPREFDPEFILILSGTVGAGAAPAGVLPAPIAKALYFNVMDYGARGDGITNDYAACQAAATAVNTAGGGVLYIPAGTYLLSQDLLIYSNTYVLGAGRATILKAKASTTTNPLTVSGVSHVIISDLQIYGNKNAAISMIAWQPALWRMAMSRTSSFTKTACSTAETIRFMYAPRTSHLIPPVRKARLAAISVLAVPIAASRYSAHPTTRLQAIHAILMARRPDRVMVSALRVRHMW